jgi:hypothetical protein
MTSKFTIDPEALSLEEKADTALESFADLLVEMAGEELLKAIDRRSIQEEEREAEFDRLLERFKDTFARGIKAIPGTFAPEGASLKDCACALRNACDTAIEETLD